MSEQNVVTGKGVQSTASDNISEDRVITAAMPSDLAIWQFPARAAQVSLLEREIRFAFQIFLSGQCIGVTLPFYDDLGSQQQDDRDNFNAYQSDYRYGD